MSRDVIRYQWACGLPGVKLAQIGFPFFMTTHTIKVYFWGILCDSHSCSKVLLTYSLFISRAMHVKNPQYWMHPFPQCKSWHISLCHSLGLNWEMKFGTWTAEPCQISVSYTLGIMMDHDNVRLIHISETCSLKWKPLPSLPICSVECHLHPKLVCQIWDRLGRPQVYLFNYAKSTYCWLYSSSPWRIRRAPLYKVRWSMSHRIQVSLGHIVLPITPNVM